MASALFNKIINATVNGQVDFSSVAFKALLVTSAYVPNIDTHNFRSDVTNQVVGTGYTAGGKALTASVARDDATNTTKVTFSDVEWPAASITARAAVIYVSRGGAATADELVAYVDFGEDKTAAGASFVFHPTSPLTVTNLS